MFGDHLDSRDAAHHPRPVRTVEGNQVVLAHGAMHQAWPLSAVSRWYAFNGETSRTVTRFGVTDTARCLPGSMLTAVRKRGNLAVGLAVHRSLQAGREASGEQAGVVASPAPAGSGSPFERQCAR